MYLLKYISYFVLLEHKFICWKSLSQAIAQSRQGPETKPQQALVDLPKRVATAKILKLNGGCERDTDQRRFLSLFAPKADKDCLAG
jgi:hypothetical protein